MSDSDVTNATPVPEPEESRVGDAPPPSAPEPEESRVGDAPPPPSTDPQATPDPQSTPDPPASSSESDPEDKYPWTKPYRFQKGHKHAWAGKPNYRRSMRERIRVMVATPAKEMTFAREIALRLGLTPEMVEKADLGDILAVAGMMHAVRGKAPYFVELMHRIDGRPGATYVDVERRPVDPTGTNDLDAERKSAIDLYRTIISDPNASVRDKLDAQAALNELLGLMQRDPRSDRERASDLLDAIRRVGEF